MSWKAVFTLSVALAAPRATAISALGATPVVDPTVAAKHDADPIILTGLDFPQWSARSNQTAKLPATDLQTCSGTVEPNGTDPNEWLHQDEDCVHNNYAKPEVDTGNALGDG